MNPETVKSKSITNNLKIINKNTSVNLNNSNNNNKEIISDFQNCNFDLKSLKATLRNKRKNELLLSKDKNNNNNNNSCNAVKAIENNSVINKKNVEELNKTLGNMKSYIQDVFKNYENKFNVNKERESLVNTVNIEQSILSEDNNLNIENSNFLCYDLPYNKNCINFSADLSMEKESDFNFIRKENLNNFNLKDYDELNEQELRKINQRTEDLKKFTDQTDNLQLIENIENFEILENKLIRKQAELKLTVENFDLFLKNEKIDTKSEIVINQLEMKEQDLINKLNNLENVLKSKESEKLSLNLSIKELMLELDKSDLYRRRLHNYIQNLRGNLRVYCRVKPKVNIIN